MIKESTKVYEKYSEKLKEESCLPGGAKEVSFTACAGNHRESRGLDLITYVCLTVALDLILQQQRSHSFLSSFITPHLKTLRPWSLLIKNNNQWF